LIPVTTSLSSCSSHLNDHVLEQLGWLFVADLVQNACAGLGHHLPTRTASLGEKTRLLVSR
jgi:hypothetical protein